MNEYLDAAVDEKNDPYKKSRCTDQVQKVPVTLTQEIPVPDD